MQPNPSEQSLHAGNGLSLNLQAEFLTEEPVTTTAAATSSSEVRVSMTGSSGDPNGGASSRRSRVNSHTHSHAHSHSHGHSRAQLHSSSEPELDPADSDADPGEPSTSLTELRCLFRWIQKSLPFLVILCAKLVVQHVLGEDESY